LRIRTPVISERGYEGRSSKFEANAGSLTPEARAFSFLQERVHQIGEFLVLFDERKVATLFEHHELSLRRISFVLKL
jgi:hypothetical protein